jgi:hypothetical protein
MISLLAWTFVGEGKDEQDDEKASGFEHSAAPGQIRVSSAIQIQLSLILNSMDTPSPAILKDTALG